MKRDEEQIDWTDEDLENISEISDADIERAAQWWKRNAEEEAREILDAEDIPLE